MAAAFGGRAAPAGTSEIDRMHSNRGSVHLDGKVRRFLRWSRWEATVLEARVLLLCEGVGFGFAEAQAVRLLLVTCRDACAETERELDAGARGMAIILL